RRHALDCMHPRNPIATRLTKATARPACCSGEHSLERASHRAKVGRATAHGLLIPPEGRQTAPLPAGLAESHTWKFMLLVDGWLVGLDCGGAGFRSGRGRADPRPVWRGEQRIQRSGKWLAL